MPPELVRARAWGTRLRPTTSPTSARATARERIHLSFMVCQPSHDAEKYDAVEGACQGGRSQDCRGTQDARARALGPPVANGQFVAVRERSLRAWLCQGPATQGVICIGCQKGYLS